MRSKVWLIVLSICGLGLTACDKEDDTALEPSAVNTSSSGNTNTVNGTSEVAPVTESASPRGEELEPRLSGTYKIAYVEYNGRDLTPEYAGITYSFNGDKAVIAGQDVNLKGNFTLQMNALSMFVDGQAGEHLELMKTYWKVTEFQLDRVTIASPFMDAPGYAIVLERQ
jgi:hypothetical protein